MKAIIVTPQLPNADRHSGDIGTFTWHFARLLRSQDEQVEIIFTACPRLSRTKWEEPFKKIGVPIVCVEEPDRPLTTPGGYDKHQAIAECVARLIPDDADVVYFANRNANGFHYVRARRFLERQPPAVVTILHRSTKWHRQSMHQWPSTVDDLAIDFRESYVTKYSDFVASPSQFMVEWARNNNFGLPAADHVRLLGYPFIADPSPERSRDALPLVYERIIIYGRLETREGVDNVVSSLVALARTPCMNPIKEIVLLSGENQDRHDGLAEVVAQLKAGVPAISVIAHLGLDACEAQAYLLEHARGSLVVIPHASELLGFTALETWQIAGVNMICAESDGVRAVMAGGGEDCLFSSGLKPTKDKIEQWLAQGPGYTSRQDHYDWQTATGRWLAFHREVCDYARSLGVRKAHVGVMGAGKNTANADDLERLVPVDVCIPYYNLGRFLPYLLESLEGQTFQDFNVFAVNDGSPDPESATVFEQMAEKYRGRTNWTFTTTDNRGVCQARNLAASLGRAEFICFLDSDNIVAPSFIERLLGGVQHSTADCITCYVYGFESDGKHTTPSGALHEAAFRYLPLGNCLVLGTILNPFGDGSCIVRRSAFEAVGGFTTDLPNYINHEDRELLTRLALAGYEMEVVPEFLLYYRFRKDSRLRTTNNFENEMRVLRHYEDTLRASGLEDLVGLAVGQQRATTLHEEHLASIAELEAMNAELRSMEAELRQWGHDQERLLAIQNTRIAELEVHVPATETPRRTDRIAAVARRSVHVARRVPGRVRNGLKSD